MILDGLADRVQLEQVGTRYSNVAKLWNLIGINT